jgi:cell wall-associated NlpC family hydrolase
MNLGSRVRISIRRVLASVIIGALGVGLFAPSVRATPMPTGQEARIVAEATAALEAIDRYADRREVDAYDLYQLYADRLALRVAVFLGVDAGELQTAWRDASVARQRALMAGLTQLGVPYEVNAERPGVGLDCSGLTRFAWKASGVSLPRGSSLQYDVSSRVSASEVQPGDLVWRPGHVALYLGVDTAIIQAPRTGRSVELHLMEDRIWSWSRFANPLV